MRKNLFWLLEIIIWLVVLSGIIIFGTCYFNDKKNNETTYQVMFDDADGLIVGSPVRIMGVQVGYVKKIRLKENKVDIIFKLDDVSMPLPKNAVATIQFSGMAGSKSLEIFNSKNPSHRSKELKIVEPVRINALFEMQDKIATSLMDFSSNVLGIFDAETIQAAREKLLDKKELSDELLDKTNEIQGDFQNYQIITAKGIDDFNKKILKNIDTSTSTTAKTPDYYVKDIIKVTIETDPTKLSNTNENTKIETKEKTAESTDAHPVGSAFKSVNNISNTINNFSNDVKNIKKNSDIKNFEHKLNNFNSTLEKLNKKKEVTNEN